MSLKKRSILETATALFSKDGFNFVGIDRIITESNVAKMTLYNHFPSKEFLIESVLIQHDHDLRASINIAIDKHETASEKLKAIFDWHGKWFSSSDFHGCMFIKASQEFPHNNSKVRKIAKNHKLWLEGVISNCLRNLNVKSYAEMAVYIITILDGLTVRSNMFKGGAKALVASSWAYVESLIGAESGNALA